MFVKKLRLAGGLHRSSLSREQGLHGYCYLVVLLFTLFVPGCLTTSGGGGFRCSPTDRNRVFFNHPNKQDNYMSNNKPTPGGHVPYRPAPVSPPKPKE